MLASEYRCLVDCSSIHERCCCRFRCDLFVCFDLSAASLSAGLFALEPQVLRPNRQSSHSEPVQTVHVSDTHEGLRLCLFDVDLCFAVPLLGHCDVFVSLPSVGHDRTMRRATGKTRIERYFCLHLLEVAVCIIEADCERRPWETRMLRMMCAITRLRRCAPDVCLRFGRTSCGRRSATQICKLSRKDWVFVEALAKDKSITRRCLCGATLGTTRGFSHEWKIGERTSWIRDAKPQLMGGVLGKTLSLITVQGEQPPRRSLRLRDRGIELTGMGPRQRFGILLPQRWRTEESAAILHEPVGEGRCEGKRKWHRESSQPQHRRPSRF